MEVYELQSAGRQGLRAGPGVSMSKHARRDTSECEEPGHVEVRTQRTEQGTEI